ncbi:uncharacterized protein BDR25DRAFT_108752 [Lindgomyces ingoldianus]|uniref:Uncharacterized protein n=1 Tax=Lindgomyces ingoldianus TaxID=673940 RepID=A0ACB6Q926_9PLEO|nr:uncharacterized protein BDR25DRAFT_108752 [Lindgomyces ingoldianus]KAF2463468.1 hypothetical protein BDR25DRAFT_108752 [Lindgomyces ingoldianus]
MSSITRLSTKGPARYPSLAKDLFCPPPIQNLTVMQATRPFARRTPGADESCTPFLSQNPFTTTQGHKCVATLTPVQKPTLAPSPWLVRTNRSWYTTTFPDKRDYLSQVYHDVQQQTCSMQKFFEESQETMDCCMHDLKRPCNDCFFVAEKWT